MDSQTSYTNSRFCASVGPMKRLLLAASLTIFAPVAYTQSLPTLTAPANATPAIYYDARLKVPGAVLISRLDTLKKLSLDVQAIYGAESSDTHYRSTVGLLGLGLTHTFPLLSHVTGTFGVAVTVTSGQQPSGGAIACLGWKF